jgi:glycosyltransferase involved in cell wall biosynthesis
LLRGLARRGGAEKIAVCYHGVALASVAAAARERGLIVSVGRLHAKKGFHDLVAACALLARAGVEFRCVVVGEGEERAAIAVFPTPVSPTKIGLFLRRRARMWIVRSSSRSRPTSGSSSPARARTAR